MKLIPLLFLSVAAMLCGGIREKLSPPASPSPTPSSTQSDNTNALSTPVAQETPEIASDQVSVSKGELDGKVIKLPRPVYPATARAVHAEGTVKVQIIVDETGKVISAKALSGHPLLKGAAEIAARNTEFEPFIISGQGKKVTAVITYTFKPQ